MYVQPRHLESNEVTCEMPSVGQQSASDQIEIGITNKVVIFSNIAFRLSNKTVNVISLVVSPMNRSEIVHNEPVNSKSLSFDLSKILRVFSYPKKCLPFHRSVVSANSSS